MTARDKLRKRAHGRLFFDGWSIEDPETLNPSEDSVLYRAHHACFALCGPTPDTVTLSRADLLALKGAAEAYHHLATHPGTESVVQQLRAIRRALREPR